MQWLSQADPKCELTIRRLNAFQERHPGFAPREHPDLDHWSTSGWVGPCSPVSVDELLGKRPADQVDWLLTFRGERFSGPDREGLLATLTESVKRDFEWGWDLAGVLRHRSAWDVDIWEHLIEAWRQSTLSEEQWKRIFSCLSDHGNPVRIVHPAARFLFDGVSKENSLPASLLGEAESLACELQKACELEGQDDGQEADGDWATQAINHWGGVLAQFWLHALSRRRAEAGSAWQSIPPNYRRILEHFSSGRDQASEMAGLFASQLHFSSQ